jgi:hypothetical protein
VAEKKSTRVHSRKQLDDVRIQLGMKQAALDEADALYREAYAELTFWKAEAERFRTQLLEHLRTRARRDR